MRRFTEVLKLKWRIIWYVLSRLLVGAVVGFIIAAVFLLVVNGIMELAILLD